MGDAAPSEGEGRTILVVDDEAPIRRFLRSALVARGYTVAEADTLAAARLTCTARPPELILLDLGLPDGDGIDLVREIRGWSALPIVVLSARGQETDKVRALDAGADDYLTKPFGVPELLARLRVALRHARPNHAGTVPVLRWTRADGTGLELDVEHRTVRRRRGEDLETIRLTPTEYRLLQTLAREHGKVWTHDALLREVWGPAHLGDVAYLRVYMGQLRRKLEAEPAQPHFLLTEPGVGYRMAMAD
jgi:two-component system KDP operon response regulator KdpE